MKKAASIVIVLVMILSISITSFGTEADYVVKADKLNKLGLFNGTNKGYELDRGLSRVEGSVMLVRILGKEDFVKEGQFQHPFEDVPAWADNYIGYLYKNGLTNGVSTTKFGSNDKMNAVQYTTLILRAIGYSDKDGDFLWDKSLEKAIEIGLLTKDQKNSLETKGKFLRGDMVSISYDTLDQEMKGSTDKLSDKLIKENVIDKSIYQEVVNSQDSTSNNIKAKVKITNTAQGDIISFPDPSFEKAVALTLSYIDSEDDNIVLKTKASGPIYVDELKLITRIYLEGINFKSYVSEEIVSIEGIQYLTNLKDLNLSNNKIEDISPLTQLTNIESIMLLYNNISDITPLGNLNKAKKIEFLGLKGNKIEDVSILKDMNIDYLYIKDNPIKDYTVLKPLYPNLIYLDEDISKIGEDKVEFTSEDIKSQVLLQTRIRAYSGFGNTVDVTQDEADSIKEISLFMIDSIEDLKKLKNLEKVEIDYFLGVDLGPLLELPKLKSLKIGQLKLWYSTSSNIDVLGELTNLEELKIDIEIVDVYEEIIHYISRGTIYKTVYPIRVPGLVAEKTSYSRELKYDEDKMFTNITYQVKGNKSYRIISYLYGDGSKAKADKIEEIGPRGSELKVLHNLKNLRSLDISGSYIQDLSFLKDMTQLKHLNIRNISGTKDIEPLRYLTNLESLYLSGNEIEDFTPVKHYYNNLKYKDFKIYDM